MEALPSYARARRKRFPPWKVNFIRQNREWYKSVKSHVPVGWLAKLRNYPPSLRKLEWNFKSGERSIWDHVLQFRPSGLRVKRYTSSPALVAMTSTQIPILGPERRFLTRIEGLRLQGFPDTHQVPESRVRTFKALGNAVHVGVVIAMAARMLNEHTADPIARPEFAPARKLDDPTDVLAAKDLWEGTVVDAVRWPRT